MISLLLLFLACPPPDVVKPRDTAPPVDTAEPQDQDGDGYPTEQDCDDGDPAVNPGAPESCDDAVDNDCDGSINESDAPDAPAWHPDADGDGWGDSASSARSCTAPDGWLLDGTDCDDTDPATRPDGAEVCDGADNDCDGYEDEQATDAPTWYEDADKDGWGDAIGGVPACQVPAGWVSSSSDCDDSDPAIHPGATELCNEVDDDCDGFTDEADAADALTWYHDGDDDGWGDPLDSTHACREPLGYVDDATDCDDTSATVHPEADEVCNDVDDDCDGSTDEDALDAPTWYADGDGDGFGVLGTSERACDVPPGMVADSTDCDDTRSTVYPGALELCNDADEDCDGITDEDAVDAPTWYADEDGDGWGDSTRSTAACDAPLATTSTGDDCDDGDRAIHPEALEVCNDADDDCDGATDLDASDAPTWYTDADGDGYGGSTTTRACDPASGWVRDTTDCDDARSTVHPGALETCNSRDDDCDALADEDPTDATPWYRDADGDGYGASETVLACDSPSGYVSRTGDCDDTLATVHPGASESCDARDNDCDGSTDEDATDASTWYTDTDGDGWGTSPAVKSCARPTGTAENDLDCYASFPSSAPVGEPGDWPRLALFQGDRRTDTPTLCNLASFTLFSDASLVEAVADTYLTTEAELSDLLHAYNPSLVLLQQWTFDWYYPSPGSRTDPTTAEGWSDDFLVRHADGDLFLAWGTDPIVDVSDADARAFLLSWVLARAPLDARWSADAPSPVYDGVAFDFADIHPESFFTEGGACLDVDLDDDGEADDCGLFPDSPFFGTNTEDAWVGGVESLTASLSSAFSLVPFYLMGDPQVGHRVALVEQADGFMDPDQWSFTLEEEDFPYWQRTLYNQTVLADASRDPSLGPVTVMNASASASEYQRVRYGLASALLAGTAFAFDQGPSFHGTAWWYDEYDGGGEGVGWLGQPLEEARPWTPSTGTPVLDEEFTTFGPDWQVWSCPSTDPKCHGISYTTSARVAVGAVGDSDATNTYLSVTITNGTDDQGADDQEVWSYDVLLARDDLDFQEGQDYVLTFWARAWGEDEDTPPYRSRFIQPFTQDASTWDYLPWGPVLTVGPRWRKYVVEIPHDIDGTSQITTSTGRVAWALGGHDGTIEIDQVRLIPATLDRVWAREFEHGLALVNLGARTDVDLGGAWDHLACTSDEGGWARSDCAVNTGATGVTSVTLEAWDGVVLRGF